MDKLRSEPGRVVAVWLTRIPQLWYQRYVQRYPLREPPGFLLAVVLVLAVVAFIGADRRSRLLMVPIGALFAYLTLVFLPLHVEPRYGMALIPSLIALAGLGVVRLSDGARRLAAGGPG